MDPRNTSFSDGGGGHRRWSLQDDGRLQARPWQAHDGALALDEMRRTGNRNEYTEGPTRTPVSQKSDPVTSQFSSIHQDTQEESRPTDVHNLHADTNVMWSASTEDCQSRDAGSGQRVLGIMGSGDQIISAQPIPAAQISNEKIANEEPKLLAAVPSSGECKSADTHSKCERCNRCRCPECGHPRPLPSCWVCGGRCVCSVQDAVEYCTCVCCVKGLFYHCSTDDEDTCADKPFSCTQERCCIRWTAVSFLAIIFPCLLCYLPARGCVAACHSCYDRATRPGCQCKNAIHFQAVSKPT
ncbi:protein sprouty homolog 2 [Hippocampus comes]|uniref:protein sprouty homolog 2 n=1 Tax=Hippocampus comes TaxID=109280 RepID=UPI00094EB918|nr:PREDICTED: protein sprouty homolog 2-like [Hippocampus comes]XP_019729419.1 PREDICTED: protein sprouty homolog 2-like [Hippocampus comes]